MLKRLAFLFVIALIGTVASATPVITSVTPNTSTVNGGIHVTIKGDGFSNCIICSPPVPPAVFFGFTPATAVTLLNPQTLDAVAPPHFPGLVDVFVYQFDGTAVLRDAFTFTGNVEDAFETILLPIYSPPVHGAYGSLFATEARATTTSNQPVQVYGIDTTCFGVTPKYSPEMPYTVNGEISLFTDCSGWPARFLFVPKGSASLLTLNERVRDISRSALSNGTEIPIVRSSRFTPNRISLLGVPVDARFRNTLRIYAIQPMTVDVSVGGQQARQIVLQPAPTIFEPAYATFSEFPIPVEPGGETTLTVTIDPPRVAGVPTVPPALIWAFITVTNNETQQITTISPDLP